MISPEDRQFGGCRVSQKQTNTAVVGTEQTTHLVVRWTATGIIAEAWAGRWRTRKFPGDSRRVCSSLELYGATAALVFRSHDRLLIRMQTL